MMGAGFGWARVDRGRFGRMVTTTLPPKILKPRLGVDPSQDWKDILAFKLEL